MPINDDGNFDVFALKVRHDNVSYFRIAKHTVRGNNNQSDIMSLNFDGQNVESIKVYGPYNYLEITRERANGINMVTNLLVEHDTHDELRGFVQDKRNRDNAIIWRPTTTGEGSFPPNFGAPMNNPYELNFNGNIVATY